MRQCRSAAHAPPTKTLPYIHAGEAGDRQRPASQGTAVGRHMHTMRSQVITQLASLLLPLRLMLLVLHASAKAEAATAVIGYMPEYRLGGNYNYVSWP